MNSKGKAKVQKPNVLLTAWRNEEKYLLEDLKGLGNFRSSGFKDVVIGWVDDRKEFLKKLHSETSLSSARVAPIDKKVEYSKRDFKKDLSEIIKLYAVRIASGESFKVSFTRRGLKGKINSQEIEREMGSIVWKELEKQGKEPKVNLEDPDKTILIESLGKLFLVGFISREIKEKYFYLNFA